MDNTLFITKDALCKSYLPIYGNKFWNTPNIDELAKNGTVFAKHYTGAPSTIMSNMCMFTGKFPHESELDSYYYSHIHYAGETLWTKAEQMGFECHIIWDEAWRSVFRAEERYFCYGENTNIHYLKDLRQGVGAHYIHTEPLKNCESKTNKVYERISNEVDSILKNATKPVLLWIHIPHVINGRTGYGTDIDAFDNIIGRLRCFFSDRNIFISADHGNMNGKKGKVGYGHDVYETSINIPLITPRIDNIDTCSYLSSNIDLATIILDRSINSRQYIYSDTAFYAQPNRKLAILTNNYKYIYNKFTKTEELYDLRTDPEEECNLISDIIYDIDRNVNTPLRELYFYPFWEELEIIKPLLRAEKDEIWKNGPWYKEKKAKLKLWVHSHGYDRIIHKLRD